MSESNRLPRSTPEEQGISSAAVEAFLNAVEASGQELHSFMLVRGGKVTAEGWWHPYKPDEPHQMFSVSKSFTATAIGLAVNEGLLSVDDKVLSFFPEKAPSIPSENLQEMRVHDLLAMGTGHETDVTGPMIQCEDGDWIKAFLEQPVQHKPGTHFAYDSGASHMLSAILQKVAGVTLFDYLQTRLFQPLGISTAVWDTWPDGTTVGGYGLRTTTESIAKLGQLYLQDGVWNGRQLVPSEWIRQSSMKQIDNGSDPDNDWHQGYGYQFWLCRHDVYRAAGMFGQYIFVMPKQNAVVAITSGLQEEKPILDAVWEHLLPAMKEQPLPPAQAAYSSLAARLRSLRLDHAPAEANGGELVNQPDDVLQIPAGRTYHFDDDQSFIKTFELQVDGSFITLIKDEDEHFSFGLDDWKEGRAEAGVMKGERMLGRAFVYRKAGSLVLELNFRFIETPLNMRMVCRFEGRELQAAITQNIGLQSGVPEKAAGRYAE
ncbi:serine hydrolase domain-containing protein [Paenibacillus tarimensis]|uniref:serine hydrolase domain-containing protein n=1 Tax=Paenibacillus tarimensis TaxID=416012 RepID=UPI001F2D3BDB|nr:serine hydrolase [Paenibacillus tarimensis]MCF2944867.1 beta-lactamase family protein [Paenibacillus tarimensis]